VPSLTMRREISSLDVREVSEVVTCNSSILGRELNR
jgi:hypothetical protein